MFFLVSMSTVILQEFLIDICVLVNNGRNITGSTRLIWWKVIFVFVKKTQQIFKYPPYRLFLFFKYYVFFVASW